MGGHWIEINFAFKGRRRMREGIDGTVRLMHDSISIYCKMIALLPRATDDR
jgi:hypothetical protein